MSEDEMHDVNGGFTLYTWMVSAPIDMALILTKSFAAFAGIKLVGRFFGQRLIRGFSGIVSKAVGKIVGVFVNISIGALGSAIFGAFWSFTYLGNLIGFILDVAIDGRADGVIYRS